VDRCSGAVDLLHFAICFLALPSFLLPFVFVSSSRLPHFSIYFGFNWIFTLKARNRMQKAKHRSTPDPEQPSMFTVRKPDRRMKQAPNTV
jgi:hypothetical protein